MSPPQGFGADWRRCIDCRAVMQGNHVTVALSELWDATHQGHNVERETAA